MKKDNGITRIRKGLDIPLDGAAERVVADACNIDTYAVKPGDYTGLVPRLLVQEGDMVSRGQALCCDKNDSRIKICAPVGGKVIRIERGEKRKIEHIVV